MTLTGAEEKCITVGASGAVAYINAAFYFSPPAGNVNSQASDFYISLKYTGISSCIQVGGRDVKNCGDLFSWKSELNSPVAGMYTDLVFATTSAYDSLGKGNYQVCFGNGYSGSQAVSFTGNASLAGLVAAPLVIIVCVSHYTLVCACLM